mgnify:CR=1 FL=1
MDASFFIASRLRFKGRLVVVSITISYLVMIVALAVSSGFRQEIRSGLSDICGDVQLTPQNMDPYDGQAHISTSAFYMPLVEAVDGVDEVRPVVYRAGIVKNEENIHGVLFKGVHREDTVSLGVSIPRRLAEIGKLKPGDRITTLMQKMADSEDDTSEVETDSFTLSSNWSLEDSALPDGTYAYMFSMSDIQGNEALSDVSFIKIKDGQMTYGEP